MTGKATSSSVPAARVFTIPSGIPFVDALAAGLMARATGDPLSLSRMTVLLPNRRACRALQEAFLRLGVTTLGASRGGAILLPRLQPIGEVDEEDLAVLGAGADALDIPPAISGLRRQMLLARLVQAASQALPRESGGEMRFDQALRLAAELARLIDQVETERLDLARIADLVPADFAAHWQITVRFLDLLRESWPEILADEGCIDPARRRNLLIERQAALWRERPPADPVIAAGSTGSIPASADLIVLVARLPQGAVVLPGLDRDAGAAAWSAIAEDPAHPQFGLAQLLRRLQTAPAAVIDWPADGFQATPPTRRRIVSHALLPAGETADWPALAEAMDRETAELAWRQVCRIDCHTEQEEAGVIALLLREAAERAPGFRAALVTPDRGLARRVAAELARWRIAIDDSAGLPLNLTAPGAFLVLIAEAAAADWAPGPLLALLKHPLAAGGRAPAEFRATVRRLERLALRGLRPAPGIAGIGAAVAESARRADGDPDFRREIDAVQDFVAALEALFGELADWRRPMPLSDRLNIHLRLAESLAASDGAAGAEILWRDEAGEALADFANGLLQAGIGMPETDAAGYAALIAELMAGTAVRPRYGLHPRLFIWGPLEARLQQADFVVLGGLNEGTWPAETAIDPWLNRPMRRDFGLPAPERKIGLSAHDFQQAMGTAEVVMTRALRVGGAPTVPSRWLLRLDAFLQCLGLVPETEGASAYRGWQRRLDRRDPVQPVGRPSPAPGARFRPQRLSVTRIETWMRDPYAIYASAILRLRALDPLDQDPGAADLGTYIHRALDGFMRAFPRTQYRNLPPDAVARLLEIGRGIFASELDRPAVWAFWWPRFERIAAWFVETEIERRVALEASYTECSGDLVIPGFTPPFTLAGKADRIDRLADGGLVIIDYKTGGVPGSGEIALGFAPQLPLEAAMARRGGFGPALQDRIAGLEYWQLSGRDPAGECKPIKDPGARTVADPVRLAEDAYRGLLGLLQAYSRDDAAYPAEPQSGYAPVYSDYRHLARIGEWSADATSGDVAGSGGG